MRILTTLHRFLTPSADRMVESKAMIYLTCDMPVALLVFAPKAKQWGKLEDYARMRYTTIANLNLPAWIIGAEEGINEMVGKALALKVWPTRKPATMMLSTNSIA